MTADAPPGLERFRNFLRATNHPLTPHRLRIAELLFGTHHHLSADEILERLRADRAGIGKATVYRTLELLLQADCVREHDFGDGCRRYEARPQRPDHEHFVCTRCGKVIEFESADIERAVRDAASLHRFRPARRKVEIYGRCEECPGP